MAEIRSAYDITDYSNYVRNSMLNEFGEALFKLGFEPNFIRRYMQNKDRIFMHNCEVCGKPDNEKPMAFRKKPWCCENHRKELQGNATQTRY